MNQRLLLSFYGDDFTGSTDAMESLSLNGIPTALFLTAPTPEEVSEFRLKNQHISPDGKLKAFGVAGISRSLSPSQMDKELPEVFEKLARIPTRYFHFKVCSTFDSSEHIGSIGHAAEIALKSFPSRHIPLIVGIPLLNRFCVFGNLFARVDGVTYRLDEHPTMSRHPVTPMNEADIRKHLAKQTSRPIALIDVLQLQDKHKAQATYKVLVKSEGFVLFDVLENKHLVDIGEILESVNDESCQFLVGSSAIEYALCNTWKQHNRSSDPEALVRIKKAEKYMVVAGSCSPRTAEQIQHGTSIGYVPIPIDTVNLVNNADLEIKNCTDQCLAVLDNGNTPILYSAMGPDDDSIVKTNKVLKVSGSVVSIGRVLGGAQGRILKNVLDRAGKIRVTVAGGDTSGYVAKSLGIYALEVLAPIAPGAPLCLAHAKDCRYDGLEICLKGGQNGTNHFFEYVEQGIGSNHVNLSST